MQDFIYNIRHYFKFDKKEIRDVLITVLVIGFIFSFKDWGAETFDLIVGLQNFLNAVLIVGAAFFVHEGAHKLIAIGKGYDSRFKSWFYGLLFSLAVAIISNGDWILLAPGAVTIAVRHLHRVGHYRYGPNYKDIALISYAGPVSHIFLALIFKALLPLGLNPALVQKAIIINIWLAIFNILPIPPFDGSKVFFGHRLFYFFGAAFIVGASAALWFMGVWQSILTSLVFAAAVFVVIFFAFEKKG